MAVKKPTGKTLTYPQLCQWLAEEHGMEKREARKVLDMVFDHIQDTLMAGTNVGTPLGAFKRADRDARTGRNPRTGESIKIPAKKGVKFKPNKALTDAMAT